MGLLPQRKERVDDNNTREKQVLVELFHDTKRYIVRTIDLAEQVQARAGSWEEISKQEQASILGIINTLEATKSKLDRHPTFPILESGIENIIEAPKRRYEGAQLLQEIIEDQKVQGIYDEEAKLFPIVAQRCVNNWELESKVLSFLDYLTGNHCQHSDYGPRVKKLLGDYSSGGRITDSLEQVEKEYTALQHLDQRLHGLAGRANLLALKNELRAISEEVACQAKLAEEALEALQRTDDEDRLRELDDYWHIGTAAH